MIGAIGCKEMVDVIMFEVSDSKIFTLSNFSRSNSVNYTDTQVLQKKPISQYVGESLDEITFKIKLKDYFGVDPRTEMNKLIYIQRDGTVISFVLDGKGFGRYRWTIRDLKMDFSEIDGNGVYHCIDLTVTLKEYSRGSEGLKSANRYR